MEWIACQGVKDEDKQPHTLPVRQVFDFGKAAVGVWMISKTPIFKTSQKTSTPAVRSIWIGGMVRPPAPWVTSATPASAIDGKIVARDGSFLPAPIRDRERGFGLKHALVACRCRSAGKVLAQGPAGIGAAEPPPSLQFGHQ